jgi:hypothetical protein
MLNYFFYVYFGISTIYAIYVYLNTYKALSNFILNVLLGPFAIIYSIYTVLIDKEERFY